jgi:uncharacterized protein GlcG (DUF336 family)
MDIRMKVAGVLLGCGCALGAAVAEEPALVTYQTLSPELAQELAEATLQACRKAGFQVAVAVVDRTGVPQVMLRDRFAGAHTPDTATRKAWTAVSFRTNTLSLAEMTQAGKPQSGVREVTNVLMIGGGLPVEAGGSQVGGVGVSGAPSGDDDEACAREGLAAIEDKLEL